MNVHILLNGYFHYQDICCEKAHFNPSRKQLELYEGDVVHIIKNDVIIDVEFRNGDIGFPLLLYAKGYDAYAKAQGGK